MTDALFVLALVVPPLVVVVAFAALALPARHETQAPRHLRESAR